MNSALEQKLIECLDALEHGRSVEQILARYPDDAVALRPMLETARQLEQLKAAPSTAAQHASRRAFLTQAAALQSAPRPTRWASQLWRSLLRGLVPVMGVAAALLVGVLLLANTAIPGEPFYGVKLQLEDWRLSLARDPDTIQTLTAQWEARRLVEVQQLLAADLEADVVFGDDIAAIASDHWMLKNGIRLNISDQTVIVGEPEIGAYLHIEGRTLNGAVEARLIHVGEHHSDLLNATPVPATETPTPSSAEKTPAPAVTLTPTPMISPFPTTTPTPTPTPSPTATGTLEVEESSSPATPDDGSSGSHDYGDDNSGSNSGDDNSGSGSGDDNSGSGSGDDEDARSNDNSGSGSGEDDGDDDNSGSGGSDDGNDDNSGSGSGDDNDGDDDDN